MMDEINMGCVVYTETNRRISAKWLFQQNDKIHQGSGVGTRLTRLNKNRPFEGEFEITYQDSKGNRSPKLRLIISYDSGHYKLVWYDNEKVTDIGIGFEVENKLMASYHKI